MALFPLRRSMDLTIDRETRSITDWATLSNTSPTTIYSRLRSGWPVKLAVWGREHATSIEMPTRYLEAVARDYPGVWKQYDVVLSNRQKLGGWPQWCFCPLAAAYAVVSGGGFNQVPLEQTSDVARVGALAAWRPTQGIYRFDPTLVDALWETPITGALPTEHLQRLPEWCVYVELERPSIYGFFAHLEHDINDGRTELRLLLDTSDGLFPVPLHLGGTLEQAAAGAVVEAQAHAAIQGISAQQLARAAPLVSSMAAPLVSVLLYLCSGDSETHATRGRGAIQPTMKRRKSGARMPPARKPEVWQTGFRLGAALRAATEAQSSGGSPRGHVRRAHWHSYWVGPKDNRRLEVRWLPPIAVNLEEEVSPTIRNVQ